MLGEILEGEDLRSVIVPDGVQALEYLQSHPVDLLVCDLDMPGMDGLEVIRRLQRQRNQHPVFVISGYLDPQTRKVLGGFGFVRGVFEKPFDLFDFSRRARELSRPSTPASADGASADGAR